MPTLAQPMCIHWPNVGPTKHCYLGTIVSWRFVWGEGLLIDNGVFQISVIEVGSFLVGFLAFLDSLTVIADLVEVPNPNFEAVDASWRQPTAVALTLEMT